jgi:hypothetical protein
MLLLATLGDARGVDGVLTMGFPRSSYVLPAVIYEYNIEDIVNTYEDICSRMTHFLLPYGWEQ